MAFQCCSVSVLLSLLFSLVDEKNPLFSDNHKFIKTQPKREMRKQHILGPIWLGTNFHFFGFLLSTERRTFFFSFSIFVPLTLSCTKGKCAFFIILSSCVCSRAFL